MFVASFFWNAALPQMEAITFNHLGPRANRYASVRLWGSIGFILTVAGLGWLLQGQGTGVVPWVVLALFFGIWGASLLVPVAAQGHQGPGEDSLRRLLRRPEILAFLASCLLMQVSHGAYYAFYSIYLKSAGYDGVAVGGLWAWGVFVEVLVFLRMHRLLERFGARRVLLEEPTAWTGMSGVVLDGRLAEDGVAHAARIAVDGEVQLHICGVHQDGLNSLSPDFLGSPEGFLEGVPAIAADVGAPIGEDEHDRQFFRRGFIGTQGRQGYPLLTVLFVALIAEAHLLPIGQQLGIKGVCIGMLQLHTVCHFFAASAVDMAVGVVARVTIQFSRAYTQEVADLTLPPAGNV